jgi:hypothetical protein
MLAEVEWRKGLPVGSTKIIPLLETARSLQFAYEIGLRERVPFLVGATAKNADVARALGTVWTPGGRETAYLKSRIVMAARAAGKLPIGGVWQQVHDLEGLRQSSQLDRELGMSGELSLHPSNVAILNEIYSPSPEQVAFYKGMIAALDQAHGFDEVAQNLAQEREVHRGIHADAGGVALGGGMTERMVLRRVAGIVVKEPVLALDEEVLVETSHLAHEGNGTLGEEFAVAGVEPVVEINLGEPGAAAGPELHMRLEIFFQAALGRHVERGQDATAGEHVFRVRAEVVHALFE